MADREYTQGNSSRWFEPEDIHGRQGIFEIEYDADLVCIYMPSAADDNHYRTPHYTLDEAENAALALLAMIRDHRNEI